MVIVRRLLGLSADAGSEDIRAFFHGLHILEGGVHIIGGKRGEAFIIFTTEEDGQLAMERSGEILKGSSVTLEVSSIADLKHKIELRLKKQRSSGVENKKSDAERKKEKMEKEAEEKKKAEYKRRKLELEKKALDPRPAPEPQPSKSPTDLGTALLLGLVAAIQGLQSNHNNNIIINNSSSSSNNNQESQAQSLPVSSHPLPALPEPYHSKNHTNQRTDHHTYNNNKKKNYNHSYKLQESIPQPVRKVHIEEEKEATAAAPERGKAKTNCNEPGYLRLYGLPNNVTLQDVRTFLQGLSVLDFIPNVFLGRDQCCLIKVATLKQAEEGLKYSHMSYMDSYVEVRTAYERMWSYALELDDEHGPCSTTSSELDHRLSPDRHSSWTPPLKRRSEDRSLSGSPKRQRFDSQPPGQVHCVMVRNLSPKTTKTEIKELFGCVHIPNKKIIHLQNCWGQRTSTAFIMFTHPEDYAAAMNMDGTHYGSKVLDVSSITMEKMRDIMYKERHKKAQRPAYHREQDWSERTCIYARNFPADVRRGEVRDFFCLYQIDEKDVTLLKDEKGNSIGEAVIKFMSEEAAKEACSLHGNIFLGQKIMLTCVSPQQMKTILQEPH
ncbi:RNA binding motif protein 12Ba [Astyanax mexicanus]|uniref:RNA binding motif protein 12Ba n=1 Tax=Astyanax mexicanus TaxID=7994 RepID=UPI0020CB001E|nr:RNA binding motif protein 12Ba [Astyanax mexicanus]